MPRNPIYLRSLSNLPVTIESNHSWPGRSRPGILETTVRRVDGARYKAFADSGRKAQDRLSVLRGEGKFMGTLLESIHSPADVKGLNHGEMESLAEEIRAFLIQTLSKTGGHLGPNLGVVELTLALHAVLTRRKIRSCLMSATRPTSTNCSPAAANNLRPSGSPAA
jgi:hypothetical protein